MTASNHSTEYSDATSSPEPGSSPGSLRNGLIGGAVAVLLTFVPLSTVLGGAVAGYLDRAAARRGTTAGAIAGVVAAVPYLAVGLYLVVTGTPLPGPALAISQDIVVAGLTVVALVYAVGLSLLGSVVGGWVHDERGG